MKAFQLTGVSEAHLVDMGEPELQNPNDVIVKMKTVSICGTDAKIYSGATATRKLPIILGHEGAGLVDQVGTGVNGALTEESRVLVDPNIYDGTCGLCVQGLPNLCETGGLMGRDGDGVLAEKIAVSSNHLYPIPASLKQEIIPLIQPLSTVVHAMRSVRIGPEDHVLVIGLGATGLLFSKLCNLKGAKVSASRRTWRDYFFSLSKEFGVDFPIDSSKQNLYEEVNEITKGKGASIVVLTANAPELLQTALDLLRPRGTIIQFFNMRAKVAYSSWDFYMKEVKLIASRSSLASDFHDSINLVQLGSIPLERLITARFSFKESVEAIHAYEDRKQNLKVIINI